MGRTLKDKAKNNKQRKYSKCFHLPTEKSVGFFLEKTSMI